MQCAVYLHGVSKISPGAYCSCGLPSIDDGRLPVMEQYVTVLSRRMFHALTVLGVEGLSVVFRVEWGT